MVNSVTTQNQTVNQINQSQSVVDNSVRDIGKDAFLKLLVAQLKNQDPLEPKDQGAFAVDLAQFTQVEQLTEINKKLSGGDNNINGLASYLGHKVVLNGDTVEVDSGDGGMLQVDLPVEAQALKVNIIDANGDVAKTITLAGMEAGKHFVELNDLDVDNGSYTYSVKAVTAAGNEVSTAARPAGMVTGFIPGASQTLLLGNREISMEDIIEVGMGK
jgi:flagellar basal-body rod modification protein FlgD